MNKRAHHSAEAPRLEQSTRVASAAEHQKVLEQQRRVEQEAAEARHVAIMVRLHAEKLKRESDPKFIARQKNRELQVIYGVEGFVKHLMWI